MIVVKIGGSEGIDLDAVCEDVAALVREGTPLVLVHGGSHETNRLATALGHPPQFVLSPSGHTSRRTDRRTLEIFEMVYCGLVNKGVVERLQQQGVRAVGLSGLDGPIWQGPRKAAIRVVEDGKTRVLHDDYTGVVEIVNTEILDLLLSRGYLPVLTPPAASFDGEAINVDGDRAAAATAVALRAHALVLLSNVPGLLRDFPDETSLVPRIARDALEDYMGLAGGRMRKKLLGAREALDGGLQRVVMGDGRAHEPVRRALAGAGTVID
ncbi:MAG: [LysW]-aminoadipate kinase [Gemmatimonadetes bacterium]|nr:[LysW]-aminoadipate kinase [Gemmatimonadota bacterium]